MLEEESWRAASPVEETLRRQLQLLKRPCHRRSAEDLKTLVSFFSKLKFFQELDANIRAQVCRYLKLDSLPAGSTLFREGEPGDKFYIILSGSVAVYIKDNDVPTSPTAQDAEQQQGSSNAQEPSDAASAAAPSAAATGAAHGAERDASPATSGEHGAPSGGAASAFNSEAEPSEAPWQKKARLLLDAGSEDTNRHLRRCLIELSAGHESDANDWLRSRHVTPSIEMAPSMVPANGLHLQTATPRMAMGPSPLGTLADVAQPGRSAMRRESCPGVAGPTNTDLHEVTRSSVVSFRSRPSQVHISAKSVRQLLRQHHRSKSSSGLGLSKRVPVERLEEAEEGEGEEEEDGEDASDGARESASEGSGGSGRSSSSELSADGRKSGSGSATRVTSEDEELLEAEADLDMDASSTAEARADSEEPEKDRRKRVAIDHPETDDQEGDEEGSEVSSPGSPTSSQEASQKQYQRQFTSRRSSASERKTLAVVLKAGEAFGEVALQTDQPRTATVKTIEFSYFATLQRDDFKSILCTTVEQQRQDRVGFIQELPLFDGFSANTVHKLSALMQRRIIARNESVYDYGTPVLHIYLARQGEFAVSCRVTDMEFASAEEAQADAFDFASAVGANANGRNGTIGGLRLREEIALRQRAQMEAERRNKEGFIVVALLTPPSVFGLSSALRGEKRHSTRVVCQSTTGTVYSLVAKELITNFTSERRNQLQALAFAQDTFHENRMTVLRRLASQRDARPKDAYPRQNAKRFWPREQTLVERLEAARNEPTGPCAVYSLQGRLQAIGACFRSEAGAEPSAEIAAEGGEEKKEKEKEGLRLKPAWKIQEAGGVVFDPYAAAARVEALQKRTQDITLQAAMKNNVFHLREDKPYSVDAGIPAPLPRSPPEYKRVRPASNSLSSRGTSTSCARSLSRLAEAAASQAAEEIGETPAARYARSPTHCRAASKTPRHLSPLAGATAEASAAVVPAPPPPPPPRSPELHLPPVLLGKGDDGGGQQTSHVPVSSGASAPLSTRGLQDGGSLAPEKLRGRKKPLHLGTIELPEAKDSARPPIAAPETAKAIPQASPAPAAPGPGGSTPAQALPEASSPFGLGAIVQSDPWSCGIFSEELMVAVLAPEGLFGQGASGVMGAGASGPKRPPGPPAVQPESLYRRPCRGVPAKLPAPPSPESAMPAGMSLRLSFAAA